MISASLTATPFSLTLVPSGATEIVFSRCAAFDTLLDFIHVTMPIRRMSESTWACFSVSVFMVALSS